MATTIEQVAAERGYPSHLFGLTPQDSAYWREPGLPWLTHEIWENRPLGYNGSKLIWCYAEVRGESMAPRFPAGCVVNVAPVVERKNLVIGKVYLYVYTDSETGQEECELGRLVKIGGNFLEAKADSLLAPSLWLLRDEEVQAVWDVYEVTHYVSYPAE